MKFNSQICTTRSQSEQLLALGLRKETADMMYCNTYYGEYICVKDDDYLEHLDFPAWSLHRLIVLSEIGIMDSSTDNIYDKVMQYIEFLIKCGDFNKEYLEE